MLRPSFAAMVYMTCQMLPSVASAEEQGMPARSFSIEVVKPEAATAEPGQVDFPSGPITETQALALPMPEDDQSE